MRILIDDIRIDDENFGEPMDIIVRTPAAAKQVLMTFWNAGPLSEKIDVLFIDHDLADEDYDGHRLLCWMFNNDIFPSEIRIVSSNPVGVQKMGWDCEDFGYHKISDRIFRRVNF